MSPAEVTPKDAAKTVEDQFDASSSSEEEAVDTSQLNDNSDDDDGDAIVTMVDVLKAQEGLQADADAVLGGADNKKCTYSEGYLPRQPLYACKTCCTGQDDFGGICLACSLECHKEHDLVELYTKRNFRCDCGSEAFKGAKCTLMPEKEKNEKNNYNHNFKGLYCSCRRPYPDPEDKVLDDMVQCVVCEDWFHVRHLKLKTEKESGLGCELLCRVCIEKAPFLQKYQHMEDVTIPDGECTLKVLSSKSNDSDGDFYDSFYPFGWRTNLCKCANCLNVYKEAHVEFLPDETESSEVYEARNLARAASERQNREMEALASLDVVQRVEAIQSFIEMKNALKDHLEQFRNSDRVVGEEDIRDFFDQLKAKRPRLDIPHNCR